MYTHGRAARHAQVSRLVVVIHYETISLCYLGTICFCYVRFVISACSIMVSRIITYGAAAKLSHNPLRDYVNTLSWHNLCLLRKIRYWCQFSSGVTIKDLWCRSETESPL